MARETLAVKYAKLKARRAARRTLGRCQDCGGVGSEVAKDENGKPLSRCRRHLDAHRRATLAFYARETPEAKVLRNARKQSARKAARGKVA